MPIGIAEKPPFGNRAPMGPSGILRGKESHGIHISYRAPNGTASRTAEVHPAKRPSSSRLGRWLFLAALAGAAAYYYYGPRLKPPQPAASAPARAGFRRGPGIIPVVT